MGRHLVSIKLSDTLTLSQCTDGLWLYDKTRGMNLSMKAKDEQACFVEAIIYYQDRLLTVEKKYSELKEKVDTFVNQFIEEEECQNT